MRIEKMKMDKIEWKNIVSGYKLVILIGMVVILGSMYLSFKRVEPENERKTASGINVVNTKVKEEEEITEENARKAAVEQFKRLGEKRVKSNQLKVQKIVRKEVEYYYITSEKNTLEIQIKGGMITKINSASVEE